MTKEEAIAEIERDLEEVQMRAQGFNDSSGEIDLHDLAQSIYFTARRASEEEGSDERSQG